MNSYHCDFCGKEFFKFPSQVKGYKKHYCGNKCRYMANHKNNEVYYENDYAYMLLTKDNITKKILFDTEDVEKIKKYKWHLHLRKKDMRYDVCANTHGKHSERKYLFMTRYLMSCPDDLVVDHINRNTLDNRKCNLRNVTILENNKNKSPFTK